MKKTLVVLMMLVLLAMLIVSCDSSADSPVIHKVTFDSDNGSEANVKEVIDGDKAPKPDDPVKTGYAFLGWYDGDTPFDFETSVKKDYSLTAKWTQTFTVYFSANGGDGSYEPQTIDYGGKVDTTKVPDPTKAGHTFLGWYDGSEKFDIYNTPITSTITLTAKWDYMVTFDPDNGEAPAYVYLESAGTIAEGTVKNPEKKSFAFKGWYTNPEDETTKFEFGTTQVTADLPLTAKWKKTYTIIGNYNHKGIKNDSYEVEEGYMFHFTDKDSNGYDWDITELVKKYNEEHSTNFVFEGWYYNGELYEPKTDKWNNTKIPVTEPITLTAKCWDKNQTKPTFYKVTFVDENDKELLTPEMVEAGKTVYIPEGWAPYKEGYTFVGWYTETEWAKEDGTKFDFDNTKVTDNIKLKAKWKINTYTVTFDSKGGTPATHTESVEYNNTVSKPADPKKYYGNSEECYFFGWYNGSEEFDFGTPITKNITLTAKWGYTVTFKSSDDATVASQVVEDGGTVTKPEDPKKEGYTFGGWYDGESKVDLAKLTVTKNYVLKAKWNINYYTVTFDSKGGTLATYTVSVVYNEKVSEPSDTPQKYYGFFEKCGFKGWYNGSEKFDFNTPITKDITLTAKWTYKVILKSAADDDTTFSIQEVEEGGTVTKPAENPKKDGCIFDKWTTDRDGENEYDFESEVNRGLTLYAQWITLKVGECVQVGTFPSNYASEIRRGKSIPWRVLDISADKKSALVISLDILEIHSFYIHRYFSYSDIRNYINSDEFIKKYGLENVDMCNVEVSPDEGSQKTTVGSGSDKIFLLSATEAETYFSNTDDRRAWYIYSDRWYGRPTWWLRTSSTWTEVTTRHIQFYTVEEYGRIQKIDYACYMNGTYDMPLRPAFWIKLNT